MLIDVVCQCEQLWMAKIKVRSFCCIKEVQLPIYLRALISQIIYYVCTILMSISESIEPKEFNVGTILITLIYHLLRVNISLFPHTSIRFVNFLEQIFALTKRKHASEAPFIYYDARTDVAASRYLQN